MTRKLLITAMLAALPSLAACSDDGDDNPQAPALGAAIERMGRPAINTALNATFNGDATAAGNAKDGYNQDDDPSGWAAAYGAEFQVQLAILDSLDRTCGNQLGADLDPDDRYAALAGLLADDKLYVNTASGSCSTYLAVEADALGILANDDCGGRVMSYDVIDVTYSAVAVGALSGVGDTVDADDGDPDPDAFPFLAAPL